MPPYFVTTLIFQAIATFAIFDLYLDNPPLEPHLRHKPGYGEKGSPSKRVVLFIMEALEFEIFNNLKDTGATPFLSSKISSIDGAYGPMRNEVPIGFPYLGYANILSGTKNHFAGSVLKSTFFGQESYLDTIIKKSEGLWMIGDAQLASLLGLKQGDPNVFKPPAHFREMDESFSRLKMWTFHKIKELLLSSVQEKLMEQQMIILVQVPQCYSISSEKRVASCLKIIDDGIKTTVNLMDDFWSRDNRTTYIFTSAYAQASSPFVLWGSGILRYSFDNFNASDLAPLVATLLDLDFPAQSQGQVPLRILDLSHEHIIKAKIANGLQMHEQVVKYQDFYQSVLTDQAYQGLDIQGIESLVDRITQLQKNFAFGAANDLANDLYHICKNAFQFCLNFHNSLIPICLIVSYVLLLVQIGASIVFNQENDPEWCSRSAMVLVIGSLLVLVYGHYYVWLPWSYITYLIMPFYFMATVFNSYTKLKLKSIIYNDVIEFFKIFIAGLGMVFLSLVSLQKPYLYCLPLAAFTVTIAVTATVNSISKVAFVIMNILFFVATSVTLTASCLLSVTIGIVVAIAIYAKNESGSKGALAITIIYIVVSGIMGSFLIEYQGYFMYLITITAIPVSFFMVPKEAKSQVTSLSFILTSLKICTSNYSEAMVCFALIAVLYTWLLMTQTSTEPLIALGSIMYLSISWQLSLHPILITAMFAYSHVKMSQVNLNMMLGYVMLFSGFMAMQVFIWISHVGPWNESNFLTFMLSQALAITLPLTIQSCQVFMDLFA